MLHVWGAGVELERERRVRRVAAAFAALAFPAAAVLLPAFVLLPITRPPIHRGQAVAMGFDSVKSRMHLPMWLLWAIATISALLGWYVQAAISRTSHSSNVSAPCLHMHMPLALMLHHTNAPRSHYNSHTYTRSPDSQVPLIHRVFGSSLKINHFNVRMLTMHRCVQLSSTPPPPPPPPYFAPCLTLLARSSRMYQLVPHRRGREGVGLYANRPVQRGLGGHARVVPRVLATDVYRGSVTRHGESAVEAWGRTFSTCVACESVTPRESNLLCSTSLSVCAHAAWQAFY